MSTAKKRGRFGYLSEQETSQAPAVPDGNERSEESGERETSAEDGGGDNTRSPGSRSHANSAIPTQGLSSVPKGRGRMKQERSQLNVRIPTSLKRQASAKAVLEGRDIGEIVEELLREYLDR